MTPDHLRDEPPDARLDLRALDSDLDAGNEQRFVDAVMTRVARLGVPASTPTDPLYGLWSLPRPLLIAASFAALAVLGAAFRSSRAGDEAPQTIADATGVPPIFLATGANRR
jgi:hypothetical protein